MATFTATSVSQLIGLIAKHAQQRTKKVQAAARRAAAKGRAHVKRNIPVAHGELRESVHSEDAMIIVDAPHAAAVNFGSRPHTPPLEPLIAWVKLRGMQGLMTDRQQGRLPGTSTKSAALGVAGLLRAHETGGASNHSPTDAAVQVARMIQQAIRRKGTKAHHFIEAALPELRALLGAELQAALASPPSGGPDGGGAGPKAPDTRARDSQGRFVKTS